MTVTAKTDWWTNFGHPVVVLSSLSCCCKSSKCLASNAGVFRRVVFPPSPQAIARNVCVNEEKCLSADRVGLQAVRWTWNEVLFLRLQWSQGLDTLLYVPAGKRSYPDIRWSADAPFFCSVSWPWASTLLPWVLVACQQALWVARIHARATREKRFSLFITEELARRLGYWSFYVACDVRVLWGCWVRGRLRYLPKA